MVRNVRCYIEFTAVKQDCGLHGFPSTETVSKHLDFLELASTGFIIAVRHVIVP